MADFLTAMEQWTALSSTGIVGELLKLIDSLGDFAGATSDLIGLIK